MLSAASAAPARRIHASARDRCVRLCTFPVAGSLLPRGGGIPVERPAPARRRAEMTMPSAEGAGGTRSGGSSRKVRSLTNTDPLPPPRPALTTNSIDRCVAQRVIGAGTPGEFDLPLLDRDESPITRKFEVGLTEPPDIITARVDELDLQAHSLARRRASRTKARSSPANQAIPHGAPPRTRPCHQDRNPGAVRGQQDPRHGAATPARRRTPRIAMHAAGRSRRGSAPRKHAGCARQASTPGAQAKPTTARPYLGAASRALHADAIILSRYRPAGPAGNSAATRGRRGAPAGS